MAQAVWRPVTLGRSLETTDNPGEWGIGVAVENFDGGFAAIVNNTTAQTNSLHISLDSGKTWNPIGEDLELFWLSLLMKKNRLTSIFIGYFID